MAQASDDYEDIEWSSYADVVLLNSLAGLRPVGANYHFCMTAVWNRFCTAMAKNVSMETIEKRLANFYDFEPSNGVVDENVFFSHDQEFNLPEGEYPGVASLSKEKETSGGKKSTKTPSNSTENTKKETPKTSKKILEIKSSEKPKRNVTVDDDKKTPAKKRGSRLSEKSTPTPKRGRN